MAELKKIEDWVTLEDNKIQGKVDGKTFTTESVVEVVNDEKLGKVFAVVNENIRYELGDPVLSEE